MLFRDRPLLDVFHAPWLGAQSSEEAAFMQSAISNAHPPCLFTHLHMHW